MLSAPRAGATQANVASASSPTSAVGTCADAGAYPAERSLSEVEQTVLCLLNGERREHGLKELRASRELGAAARWHSNDMVLHRYFAHRRAGGPGLVQRVRRTGYLHRARGWAVGENIAWGSGEFSTPGSIVHAWMHNPGHKRNILNPSFRQIGIGIARGTPTESAALSGSEPDSAVVVTTDFGRRF